MLISVIYSYIYRNRLHIYYLLFHPLCIFSYSFIDLFFFGSPSYKITKWTPELQICRPMSWAHLMRSLYVCSSSASHSCRRWPCPPSVPPPPSRPPAPLTSAARWGSTSWKTDWLTGCRCRSDLAAAGRTWSWRRRRRSWTRRRRMSGYATAGHRDGEEIKEQITAMDNWIHGPQRALITSSHLTRPGTKLTELSTQILHMQSTGLKKHPVSL